MAKLFENMELNDYKKELENWKYNDLKAKKENFKIVEKPKILFEKFDI